MSAYLSPSLRERLIAVDGGRCAYCQTAVENTGQPLTIDHIIPQAQGGQTDFGNLCFACRRCNEYKGKVTVQPPPHSSKISLELQSKRPDFA
jgi:5-methylcytosine-specific restriction endonuclease McrA